MVTNMTLENSSNKVESLSLVSPSADKWSQRTLVQYDRQIGADKYTGIPVYIKKARKFELEKAAA